MKSAVGFLLLTIDFDIYT